MEHEAVENRLAIGVMVQLVSDGLNPLPEIPTDWGNTDEAITTFGDIVIPALGAPTVKVAPAKKPLLSVTLTR